MLRSALLLSAGLRFVCVPHAPQKTCAAACRPTPRRAARKLRHRACTCHRDERLRRTTSARRYATLARSATAPRAHIRVAVARVKKTASGMTTSSAELEHTARVYPQAKQTTISASHARAQAVPPIIFKRVFAQEHLTASGKHSRLASTHRTLAHANTCKTRRMWYCCSPCACRHAQVRCVCQQAVPRWEVPVGFLPDRG